MRKSLELQSQAIDEVMTTMSQIALLDNALGYVALRPFADITHYEDDAEERLDALFSNIQTPDIDAELLDKIATSVVGDFGGVAGERMAQTIIAERVQQNRKNLVERQKHFEKPLYNTRLHVIPHAGNIVFRGNPNRTYSIARERAWPPIRAEEAINLKTQHNDKYNYVCSPKRHIARDENGPYYRRYIGYSLVGLLIDKREGRNMEHFVSLVNTEGAPQATITLA